MAYFETQIMVVTIDAMQTMQSDCKETDQYS